MRVHFSFAAGAWAAATAAASLISWAGVQIVTSAVTPSPVAVVPSSQIRPAGQPAASRPTPSTTDEDSTTRAPVAHSSLTAAPAASPTPPSVASAAGSPAATTPTTSATSNQVAAGPNGRASITPSQAAGTSPSTVAPTAPPATTPPTTAPPPTNSSSVADYTTPGGTAEFGCAGDIVTLLSASPADGYQMYVTSDGPRQAQVYFVNPQYQDSITATCVNGQPSGQTAVGSHYGGWNSSPTTSTTSASSSSTTTPSGG